MPCRPVRLLEVEQARSSLAYHFLSSVVCCALVCTLGTVECWGGRQGGCGLALCVCRLRVCGSPLAVCLVSLFVSVCRSCVSSSSVQRPPIPRWCPVRAWLFFTFLPTYLGGISFSITRESAKSVVSYQPICELADPVLHVTVITVRFRGPGLCVYVNYM